MTINEEETIRRLDGIDGILYSKRGGIIRAYYSSFKGRYIYAYYELEKDREILTEVSRIFNQEVTRGGTTYNNVEGAYRYVAGRLSLDDVKDKISRPLLKYIIDGYLTMGGLEDKVDGFLNRMRICQERTSGLKKTDIDELVNKHVEEIMRHFEGVEYEYYKSRSQSERARAEFDAKCLRDGGIAQFF